MLKHEMVTEKTQYSKNKYVRISSYLSQNCINYDLEPCILSFFVTAVNKPPRICNYK